MKSLIVEDSRLLRTELKKLLEPHTHIQLCGEAANPRDALPLIHQERPELLFLDINMPGKSGFDLLDALDYEPKVIFITAYSEYALRSFEFSTVDYLLKPLTAERLHKALEKLRALERCTENEKPEPLSTTSRVLLRDGETCHWVCLQDIHYLESQDNQSSIIWNHGNALIYRVLTKIEERLPSAMFFRANRRQIVNIHKIKKVDPWFNGGYKLELQSGAEIEVSRRHATRFKDAFSL
jgi:two-component system, LytTR family, response regulator